MRCRSAQRWRLLWPPCAGTDWANEGSSSFALAGSVSRSSRREYILHTLHVPYPPRLLCKRGFCVTHTCFAKQVLSHGLLVDSHAATSVALAAMTFGMGPSWSIIGSEYMATVGGTRAGTLTSWVDAPGYILTTYFLKTYAGVLEASGWAGILLRLQVYAITGLVCVCAFYYLETGDPTTRPHPRLTAQAMADSRAEEHASLLGQVRTRLPEMVPADTFQPLRTTSPQDRRP